ncbi:MAG: DUF4416 family protein [candidate division WOR-3 bacterium]
MINDPLAAVIWGIITRQDFDIPLIEQELIAHFGKIIHRSQPFAFNYTDYYEKEMGKDLIRYWLMTEKLVSLTEIVQIKNFARTIEQKYLTDERRRVNIDPGFITLSNFILATTKNYAHRIYLGNKIFAEVTLIFRNHSFQALDWTYPDYKNAIQYFNQARTIYKQLLHNLR